MAPRRSVRVSAARIVGLKDLQARMATANDHAYHLDYTSAPEDFQTVMDALSDAYWIAAALARKTSRTGCADHPHGAVDPVAPEGWGKCLICNGRRRRGRQEPRNVTGQILTGATSGINRPQERTAAARQPAPPEAAKWREPGTQVPPPLDSPILAARRERSDRTRAAALTRARKERAAARAAAAPDRPEDQ